MLKGTYIVDVTLDKIAVTVDCGEGFDGTRAELDEAVLQAIIEDIEGMPTEGDGWMSTDITVHIGA